ncbi:unnamed protein product [Paramecium pentaurelia]|uniref:Vacuolar sorting receptor thioredoxin-like domain-containing protein n=1 Tax=Paramecium pentaurelia TaxID=43138 RepID=A0A8S1WN90_9CILI|nr:unnamed protein product [Paramecium pentaurelia]
MLFLSILIGYCVAQLNLTIGIDITNKESLNYLGRLEQYYEQFEEKGLSIYILNHILPCYTCKQRHNYTQPEPNCFGGGRYCQFSTYANGQLVLTEILRQNCLFTKDIYIFLSYINLFQQECVENPHYTFCSDNILKNIINYNITEIDECINASFIGKGDQALLENQILAQEMNKKYNQSSLNVYLDNIDITNLQFNEMIIQLCQKLNNDPPEYCNIYSLVEKNTTIKLDEQIFFYLFIVILILLILISIKMLKKVNYVIQNKASIPIEETIGIISEENVQ